MDLSTRLIQSLSLASISESTVICIYSILTAEKLGHPCLLRIKVFFLLLCTSEVSTPIPQSH